MTFKLSPYSWFFPESPAGMRMGLTDGNIDYFTADTNKSLSKEICQNSIDANLNPDKPTIVEFHSFTIKKDQIPKLDELTNILEKCKEYGKSFENDKDTEHFFENALKIARNEEISILRISDFNTTGLTGADRKKSPWDSFTKTTGESDKASDKGGSKGVGKFSLFAASPLRTVFISTLDKYSNCASEGIARLTSFFSAPEQNSKSSDNEIKTIFGYGWCGQDKKRGEPLFKQLNLDPDFIREVDNYGTDIFIVGFESNSNWIKEIIIGAINSFFVAIHRNALVVKVEDEEINKNTLPLLIEKYKDEFHRDRSYVDEYYKILTAPEEECKTVRKNIAGKGEISLRLMLNSDFSRRVAMVRSNGMKIFDKDRISGSVQFSGVMIVEGRVLNEILRKLEDPQHSSWKATKKTYLGEKSDTEAKVILDEIHRFIVCEFNKLRPIMSGNAIDPRLGSYLAVPLKEGEKEDKNEVLSDSITGFTKKVTQNISKTKDSNKERIYNPNDIRHREDDNFDEDGISTSAKVSEDENGDISAQKRKNDGTRDGPDNPPSPYINPHPLEETDSEDKYSEDDKGQIIQRNKKIIEVSCSQIRSICTNRDAGEYLLRFSPKFSAESAFVEIFISAETKAYKANIATACMEVKGEKKVVSVEESYRVSVGSLKKNQLVRLFVTLNDITDLVSFEVDVYGHKK